MNDDIVASIPSVAEAQAELEHLAGQIAQTRQALVEAQTQIGQWQMRCSYLQGILAVRQEAVAHSNGNGTP